MDDFSLPRMPALRLFYALWTLTLLSQTRKSGKGINETSDRQTRNCQADPIWCGDMRICINVMQRQTVEVKSFTITGNGALCDDKRINLVTEISTWVFSRAVSAESTAEPGFEKCRHKDRFKLMLRR
ncbi:uncharacterized protein LY89DRAFT_249181 [Mollisia scopiformis]|uniref:Uncharacterized protein n=1 Tax=Mollisia scopiformis TaxID=149040 RepID=A0A194WRS9_MOLSC|nr:uncharacterized protein LY89DRAFT_249181 [Mollisia scopiformis]KUJ10696.1 hypothetical protein LY89DRAFT_249181 [Mollisia scopiformis]